jgi:hypothetical protein
MTVARRIATLLAVPAEIPLPAQQNGAPCAGVVNVDEFFTNCVG